MLSILFMFFNFLKSKWDISRYFKDLQFSKIEIIFSTEEVLKVDKSINSSEVQL